MKFGKDEFNTVFFYGKTKYYTNVQDKSLMKFNKFNKITVKTAGSCKESHKLRHGTTKSGAVWQTKTETLMETNPTYYYDMARAGILNPRNTLRMSVFLYPNENF